MSELKIYIVPNHAALLCLIELDLHEIHARILKSLKAWVWVEQYDMMRENFANQNTK